LRDVTATVVGDGGFGQPRKAACCANERIDAARFDVIHPAVQIHTALLEHQCHRWVRAQVGWLCDHVFANHPGHCIQRARVCVYFPALCLELNLYVPALDSYLIEHGRR
jgi:hypothetical protein